LSLGIETLGGVCTRLIERNSTIPTKKSQVFSTAADSQTSVDIHILQGEREMAAGNKTLGRFQLTDIPPAPRGVPQIEVTFDIDANGIVNVSAKDLGTGNEQKITITSSTNLTDEEIDKAVKEAEAFANEDKLKKEEIDTRNNADSLIYQTEKTINEAGDKLSEDDKKAITEKIDALKETLKGTDVEAIKKGTEELNQKIYEFAQKLYQQAGPQGAPGAEDTGANPESGAYEADYNVVDEDENK